MELGRDAGGQSAAHAVVAIIGLRGRGQQDRHHRPQQIGDRRAMPGQSRAETAGRKAFHHHQPGTGKQRLKEGPQRIDMKQRQGGEQHILRLDFQHIDAVEAPPEELRLWTAHALGGAGGA